MNRRHRRRTRPLLSDALEGRALLAAIVPGNEGQILRSQFQPFGFRSTVGSQWDGVRLGGPLRIDVVGPADSAGGSSGLGPINAGVVADSQFNGDGFQAIGLQFRDVRVGGGLTVFGSDNEEAGAGADGPTSVVRRVPMIRRTVVNKGAVANSQFNDGGFGRVDITPDGRVIAREGRVGFQWQRVGVRGPVDVGVDVDLVEPGGPAGTVAAAAATGTTEVETTTNTGTIRDSQFNDGGFGDVGLQWDRVGIGGRVATSSNSLFLRPAQDNTGPITVEGRTFGRRTAGSAATTTAGSTTPDAVVRAARQDSPTATTDTNSATNSGRIVGAQFNDGGFGDVGLQWKKVRVGGSVAAVHNSLTVQPENRGQGAITVRDVRFPAVPPATPATPRMPLRELPTDPPAVSDGDPVADLPTPTGPLSPYFPTPFAGPGTVTLPDPGNYPLVNSATSSGLIRGGQFSEGGFGDQGLQWLNVRVGGSVKVVHNSLSVHPEGSGLAGISVSDVRYGRPVSRAVARGLVTTPSLVISPGSGAVAAEAPVAAEARRARTLSPPNDRILTNQQVVTRRGTDIFVQWNGVADRRGLVVVHNILKISGVGLDIGPITLRNIRFPFRSPLGPLGGGSEPAAAATVRAASTVEPILNNAADNSGILDHAQFSGGGFGDDALQWRGVAVEGGVEAVHNTLAVDASADASAGDAAGPITVQGITFNSGALRGVATGRGVDRLVAPPDVFRVRSTRPVNPGTALPTDPTVVNNAENSGIVRSGQFASGAANHVLLQWHGVRARGPIRVIDNVLSISVRDRPSGPITISDVTFA